MFVSADVLGLVLDETASSRHPPDTSAAVRRSVPDAGNIDRAASVCHFANRQISGI